MTSYEVRMADSVENTGLDCRYFATLEEAQEAANVVNAEFPRAKAEVCESKEEPNITLVAWNESGW